MKRKREREFVCTCASSCVTISQLEKQFGSRTLPELPSRKSSSALPEQLQAQVSALNAYLSALIHNPNFVKCDALNNFLSTSTA
jgi:hypothetical protein